MFFWRIEGLKARLAAGPLADHEVLPYVVATTSLCTLIFAMPIENPNNWDTASGLLALPVVILGTLWVYWQNGERAGTDFLQRYTAIGWVVLLRLMPVLLAGSLALYVMKGSPSEATLETTGPDVLFGLGALVFYFQRVGHHVRQVARLVAAHVVS